MNYVYPRVGSGFWTLSITSEVDSSSTFSLSLKLSGSTTYMVITFLHFFLIVYSTIFLRQVRHVYNFCYNVWKCRFLICMYTDIIISIISTFLGMNNFIRDMKFMLGVDLGIYWKFCWAFFIPVSLTGILLYILIDLRLPTFDGQEYPEIAYSKSFLSGWFKGS